MRPASLVPLFASATALTGIGPRLSLLLKKCLNLPPQVSEPRVLDLLWHLPAGVIDRRAEPALKDAVPKNREYIEVLGLLYSILREIKGKSRNEVEEHIDNPNESPIFQRYPTVVQNKELTIFICDYCRLIIMGNARTHEIESLMDEEIETLRNDQLKAYHAMTGLSDGLPALGICAAVLGVIKAMGSLNESPEVLGHLIGAALVGTFAGVFFSYGIFTPIATKIKITREKKMRLYIMTKQTLLAFMNGAMPQVALEYGRKTISAYERPTIDQVEEETIGGGKEKAAA